MNNAEKYFNQQKKDDNFLKSYNKISEQVDIEWELERVKNHIEDDYEKTVIINEIEKLQQFIHQSTFLPQSRAEV